MTDKREPSFDQGGAPAETPGNGKPTPAPAPSPARVQRSSRTPPEEPAAFQRWIEIEKLKVELKRLEFEAQHLQTVAEPASNMLAYVTLALIAAVAGLLIYVVATLVPLREEVERLRLAQAAAPAAIESTATPAPQVAQTPVPEAPAPQPSAAPAPPQAPDTPANSASTPAETPPAAPSDAPAAPAGTAPVNGAASEAAQPPAATAYTVRIFATASVDKGKLERFANVARAAGFTVDVSAAEVFQPLRNAISYHPSVQDAANRLARALQAKYPGVNLDVRASPSITDIAKNVLILNIMDDAVN